MLSAETICFFDTTLIGSTILIENAHLHFFEIVFLIKICISTPSSLNHGHKKSHFFYKSLHKIFIGSIWIFIYYLYLLFDYWYLSIFLIKPARNILTICSQKQGKLLLGKKTLPFKNFLIYCFSSMEYFKNHSSICNP